MQRAKSVSESEHTVRQSSAAYPACVHHLFEAQVERSPQATAAEFNSRSLTYRELNAKANQLAHELQRIGVGPEVLVGICLEPSLDMIVGLLAILKAGGAYVPLDPIIRKTVYPTCSRTPGSTSW